MKLAYISLLSTTLLLAGCQDSSKADLTRNAMSEKSTTVDTIASSNPKITFQNKAHELVYEMTKTVGDYSKLRGKKDVTYTYSYTTANNQTDRVDEKYIFDGENSYGAYQQHERTFPQLEGLIEQGYDGQTFWLRHDGKYLDDEAMMKRVTFNRKTNFYWFTMFQKLMDPGLNYDYVKEEILDGKDYDVVKVAFESKDEKPTDVYQLWINKKTHLVDQFLFTVADFGVIETPNLMVLEYEKFDGFMIPSTRKYTKGDWDGNNITDKWVHVKWSNILFDTNVPKAIFSRK